MVSNSCKICSINKNPSDKPFWDKFLFESDNFYAIPSLGSLVVGWVLIFSKEHFLSSSELSLNLLEELDVFREKIQTSIEEKFGHVTVFEHGPRKMKSLFGCGVDHFHMHLVPLGDLNLLNHAKEFDSKLQWTKIDSILNIEKDKEYLYLKAPNTNISFVAYPEEPYSQFFRRVISENIGIPEKYDWKTYPMIENIKKTIAILKDHKVEEEFFAFAK